MGIMDYTSRRYIVQVQSHKKSNSIYLFKPDNFCETIGLINDAKYPIIRPKTLRSDSEWPTRLISKFQVQLNA